MTRPPPSSPLFPYTTLFRSHRWHDGLSLLLGGRREGEFFEAAEGLLADLADAGRVAQAVGKHGDIGHRREYGPADWQSAADRKSTRLNSSHMSISYAVFCLK